VKRFVRALPAVAFAMLLAACFNTLDWREFKSEEGHYSIIFPGKANHEIRSLPTPFGKITMYMDSTSAGDALFGVGYADYPPDYLAKHPPGMILDQTRDALLQNIGARSFSEAPLRDDKLRGRSLHAEGRSGDRVLALDAHLVFAGNRYYQVIVVGNAGLGRIDREGLATYFDSFRVAD
jgi:hypothetical protein